MVAGMVLVFGGLFFAFSYVCIGSLVMRESADREQLGSYGHDIIGMSYSESTNLILVFNAVGIPARLLTGWIVDKYVGPLNGMNPLCTLNGVFAFAWIGVTSRTGLYVLISFYGLSAGAYQSLLPTKLTCLNKDLAKNGVMLGMALSKFSLSGLSVPPIAGVLLETHGGGQGGHLSAQVATGAASMVGSCLMVVARVYQKGWSLRKKC